MQRGMASECESTMTLLKYADIVMHWHFKKLVIRSRDKVDDKPVRLMNIKTSYSINKLLT